MDATDTTTPLSGAFSRLNLTQALGALNDNLIKLIIVFFLVERQGSAAAGTIAALGSAAFVAPFLVFSALAGSLADRLPKQRVIVAVKCLELGIAALAAAASFFGIPPLLYLAVFLLGSHSAFLAPAKYGIIPELVPREGLSRANSRLEMFSFTAIILGTALAPLLVRGSGGRHGVALLAGIGAAAVGLALARTIPAGTAAAPGRSAAFLPTAYLRTLREIRKDGDLLLAVLGSAYFLFVGAFCQLNLLPYGMACLGLSETESGYLFLAAALGIGGGSLLAGRLSGRSVEFGIVPIGAAGLTLASFLLHAAPASLPAVLVIVVLFGVSAGLFIVPLQAFVQLRAPAERRGEVLAASSFLSWAGVLAASALLWLLSGPLGVSPGGCFTFLGAVTLLLTLVTLRVLPDFLLRFAALLVMKLCYRIRVAGAERVPLDGPALLVANHVSWLDALLLIATQQRRIRFVMERAIYSRPPFTPLFRLMGVIPVSSRDGKKEIVDFIRSARGALDEGYLVCIFAEGAITRSGMVQEFKAGFERIMRGSDYPIIPVYIGGAWGSILSYAHGKLLAQWPTMRPYPVRILFGVPLPAASSAVEVRQAVMELSCVWFDSRKETRRSLGEEFVAAARENWRRHALSDTSGRSLTYGEALTGALALAKVLEPICAGQERVGVLLPPSVGGALANLAVALLGKVPVNLNYTASADAFSSAIGQCGIRTVVSSSAFLERFPLLPVPDGTVAIEEILGRISPTDKRRAFLAARLLPRRLLVRAGGFFADAPATIIFSSGSTGEPKGVVLSHHNILSNLEALRMVFRVTARDNICSALPFFHSLGFTGTLWLPLLSGFSAAYHVNPMEGERIAEVVRTRRSTLLIATPTFLLAYIRRARPEDFATLRLVITGAEKLKSRVADAFRERFGITPLEGYGATELSPVITLSLPDVEIDGVQQRGSKEGSVGHPIPGVALRIIDPESGAILPPGEAGLVLVKGPNVMLGYLNRPDKTAEVLRDGWYATGDIGIMDQDGFLRITDRLSRFSKIGGEMVPHGAVEDELHDRLGKSQVVGVTAVPDARKGERLVVLYTRGETDGESLHRLVGESTLPNLWKPGRDCYLEVEALPVLGTGKLDLKGMKELAQAAMGRQDENTNEKTAAIG